MNIYSKNVYLFMLCAICFLPLCLSAGTDALLSRCRAALQEEITGNSLGSVCALIEEIRKNEKLYLKSSLYTDIRDCYRQLQAKLGKYYFENGDFTMALTCYREAAKYSVTGYKEEIAACRKHTGKIDTIEKEPETKKEQKTAPIKKPTLSYTQTSSVYIEIVKLWKAVSAIDDEAKAVSFVVKNAPLRTVKNKAYARLDAIKEKWIKFFEPGLQAKLNLMLAELYARTDNPAKQVQIMEEVVGFMGNTNINPVSLTPGIRFNKKRILNIIGNVKLFLELKDAYIKPSRSNTLRINRLSGSLDHAFLTPAQRIKAHYMAGILLSRGKNYVPACYHLYQTIKLMDHYRIPKVAIVWQKHSASIIPTTEMLGKNFVFIKQNSAHERAFKRAYGKSCFNRIEQCTAKYIKEISKKGKGGIGRTVMIIIIIVIVILILAAIGKRD
jgi:tetratricopeptide (TPR) repeat protein